MKKIAIIVLLVASGLFATVPMREGSYPGPVKSLFVPDTINPLKLRFNYLYEFAQIAQFCADWQLDDPDSSDHGGMIEAESGALWDVIQTDNTQEAIWVWSRYGELTGDIERFRDNIEKAWFYCENFPAWEEEGASWDHYYRDHNCAWGIAAEQRYRAVYGDGSYEWYRDSCAEFIKNHPLNVLTKINRFVNGWCAGWLYIYGEEMTDEEALDSACSLGDTLLGWVDNMTPQYGLTEEGWAMSSGTMVWGICNSSFRRDELRGQEWIADNGQYLDTFQAWKNLDYYSWDNSWNVAFANGHWAMYDISGDPTYARHHKWLTHKLLSYDTDDDGGIMATTQDADTTDMSWVSTYLCMMGLDHLIGQVFDKDAGALEIIGLHDGDQIDVGTALDLRAVVSNYGREPLSGIEVVLEGDASGSGTAAVDFLGADTVLLASDWVVTDSAVLTVSISHQDDENPLNDTYVVRLNNAAVGIAEDSHHSPVSLEVSAFSNSTCYIRCNFSDNHHGNLTMYDVLGTVIREEERVNEVTMWDISDLASGTYFVILRVDQASACERLILIR